MSGYRTHALIGAVGGLAAYREVARYASSLTDIQIRAFDHIIIVPQLAVAGIFVVGMALLALWPDIDEPGSRISNLFQKWLGPGVGICGAAVAVLDGHDLITVGVVGLIGVVCGTILALPVLKLIHEMAGGHRRLTHSLILGLPLLIGGGAIWHYGIVLTGLLLMALGFGQLFHLVGDIVTPGGVPVFYPLSNWEFHALPPGAADFGEPLIAALSLILGVGLILI